MIEGGIAMMIVSLLLVLAEPAHATLAHRRWARATHPDAIGQLLRDTFEAPPPTPSLAELVARADAALDRDRLLRGVARTSRTYDQA